MKGLRSGILPAFTCLVIAIPANAQPSTTDSYPRIGVGVAIADFRDILSDLWSTTAPPNVFTVPIDVSERLRIEPEIGYFSSSDEYEDSKTSRGGKYIALGLFPMARMENLNLYFGLRLGITSSTYSYRYSSAYSTYRDDVSMSGYSVAPAIGGEYMVSDCFSLGGEAQVKFSSSKGDHEDESGKETVTESATATRALLFVRFYFK